VRWLIIRPGWWLLRRLGRALWRGRDLHAAWWAAVVTYAATAAVYATGVPWWAVAAAAVALAVAAHQAQSRWPWLPAEPETAAGAVAVAGLWSAVAVAAVPWSRPAAAAWTVWTAAVTVWWWRDPDARSWRHLRARVRNWTAALPMVLAELGAAGVVIAERPLIAPRRGRARCVGRVVGAGAAADAPRETCGGSSYDRGMTPLPVVHYAPLGGPAYLLERQRLPDGWGARIAWVEVWGDRPQLRVLQVMYEDLAPIPGQDYSAIPTRTVRP
jgi:hypothetical protein